MRPPGSRLPPCHARSEVCYQIVDRFVSGRPGQSFAGLCMSRKPNELRQSKRLCAATHDWSFERRMPGISDLA